MCQECVRGRVRGGLVAVLMMCVGSCVERMYQECVRSWFDKAYQELH